MKISLVRVGQFERDIFVVGQEFRGFAQEGGLIRAKGLGLTPLRVLPYAVNLGSIIIIMLCLVPGRTPVPFVGDQDALWALRIGQSGCVDARFLREFLIWYLGEILR